MRPPPSLTEIQISLMGAWRLFRRDPGGLAYFGSDEDAFWKSFWCALVVAPAYIAIIALVPSEVRVEASFARIASVEVISYAIGWAAWPLVVHTLFGVLGTRDRYIPYIVAYNWSAGPQVVLLLAISLVAVTFNLPLETFAMMNLAALVWLLMYHGYIIKVAARLDVSVVIFMVLGEAILSYVITAARDMVMMGMF